MRRRRIPFLIRSFCLINTERMRKRKNAEFTKTQQLMEIDSEIEQNKEIMDDFIEYHFGKSMNPLWEIRNVRLASRLLVRHERKHQLS